MRSPHSAPWMLGTNSGHLGTQDQVPRPADGGTEYWAGIFWGEVEPWNLPMVVAWWQHLSGNMGRLSLQCEVTCALQPL